jgi:arylsulfatase
VITQGGLTGGYGLYMRDGKAHFVYNLLAMDLFIITSDTLPKGKVTLMVDFAYAGKPGEFGKGAFVTILVNGQKAGEGKLPRTIPNKFALGEGLDIGTDLGSAVDSTYKVPFTFTGKVEKVTFDLK